MNMVDGAKRGVVRTADATTATAGALGGAVLTGAIGAVKGAAAGVRNGVKDGGNSSVAAVLTLAAIGAAGLVEWPLVLGVGGAALLIHKLGHRDDGGNGRPKPTATKATPAGGRTAKTVKRTQSAGRR
jgi:hypothetical protein